jgi:hypothetical protein
VKENLKTNQAEYFNFVHASMQRTETHAYQKKTKTKTKEQKKRNKKSGH